MHREIKRKNDYLTSIFAILRSHSESGLMVETRDDFYHASEWKNSGRDRKLVGSRFCSTLVSKRNARERATRLVRATLRAGRGEFDILFSSRFENGRALVCCHAGWIHLRSETPSAPFVPLDGR